MNKLIVTHVKPLFLYIWKRKVSLLFLILWGYILIYSLPDVFHSVKRDPFWDEKFSFLSVIAGFIEIYLFFYKWKYFIWTNIIFMSIPIILSVISAILRFGNIGALVASFWMLIFCWLLSREYKKYRTIKVNPQDESLEEQSKNNQEQSQK